MCIELPTELLRKNYCLDYGGIAEDFFSINLLFNTTD